MNATQLYNQQMNVNSTVNQRIKDKFVRQHVFCNIGPEAEFILAFYQDSVDAANAAPYHWDDIENIYFADFNEMDEFIVSELDQDEIQEMLLHFECETFEQVADEEDEADVQEYLQENHNFESKPKEIYEWWKVSGYLLQKLQEKGESVIPHANIWGRGATGQAISLDYVISQICVEMEILEGQANDWSA